METALVPAKRYSPIRTVCRPPGWHWEVWLENDRQPVPVSRRSLPSVESSNVVTKSGSIVVVVLAAADSRRR